MTLSAVSLLAANVDEAAADLAAYLTAHGIDTAFESGPHDRRTALVESGEADIVWLCGWSALETRETSYELIAAPSFIGEGSGSYRSVVISRGPSAGLEALCEGGVVWATNEPASWSGRHALVAECDLRGHTPPETIVWSGSHIESIRMVADGEADAAAIDSTVWRWADVEHPVVVDMTAPWPAPPILMRRDLMERAPEVSDMITGADGLRGIDRLAPADWHHLDAMAGWARR